MKKALPVHVLSSAKAAIAVAQDWWRSHREKAQFAFDEELERALELISRHRALAARDDEDLVWFWIGDHDADERLLHRR